MECEPKHDARWAVIVGSGFGAAVTACRLAQAYASSPDRPATPFATGSDQMPRLRRSICVLERGRRFGSEDFPRLKLPDYLTADSDMRTSRRVPEVSRLLWGIDQGLFDLRNLGKLQVVQAAGYGGGSLIYANVHLQPPAPVFNDWPAAYRGDAFDADFERVAQWLEVAPLPHALRERYPKTVMLREAAERLGRVQRERSGLFYPPLAIRFPESQASSNGGAEVENPFGRRQRACNGCGNCIIGCQQQAKNTLDLNYLAHAERLGAEVRTLCEVLRIESFDGGEAHEAPRYEVVYFDHLEGAERSLLARHVFLGAGAIGTTQLLLECRQRGDLRPRAPAYRHDGLKHVGERFFSNGDNLGVVFKTRRPAKPSHGPTITTALLHVEEGGLQPEAHEAGVQHARTSGDTASADEASAQYGSSWFLIQDGGMAASLERALGYFQSPIWFGRNRLTRAADAFGASTPVTRASTSVEQILSDAATALAQVARRLGGRDDLAEHAPAALPTEWIQFLPAPLRAVLEHVRDATDLARRQATRVETRVLEKLGPRTLFLSRRVDPRRLLGDTAEAVSELYPPLRQLLREQRGLDLGASLLSWLLLGDRSLPSHAMALLAMGPDQEARLELQRGRLRAVWKRPDVELFGLQERLMRDLAVELGGELRTNPNWTLGRRPVTVHAQGGCGMGDPGQAVTDDSGAVYGFDGLHVVDAAAFPTSVGVNPSSTIAAVAERKVMLFLERAGEHEAKRRLEEALQNWQRELAPSGDDGTRRRLRIDASEGSPRIRSAKLPLTWPEQLTGWFSAPSEQAFASAALASFIHDVDAPRALDPVLQRAFQTMERTGLLGGNRIVADLGVVIDDFDRFERSFGFQSESVAAAVSGTIKLGEREYRTPSDAKSELKFVFDKPAPDAGSRACAHGEREQRGNLVGLSYRVALREAGPKHGSDALTLIGRKFFHDDPGQDIWPDLTTLYFVLTDPDENEVRGGGVMRVGLQDFLLHQLPEMDATLRGSGGSSAGDASDRFAPDQAARAWALLRFARVCFGGIENVYERWF